MSMQFLHPGEYFFGVPSHVMTTLLGSCVALVAWHPVRHLTLVSHVVLPEIPDGGNVWDPRYAEVMMERWLADLRSVGCFPIEFRLGHLPRALIRLAQMLSVTLLTMMLERGSL